MTLWSSKLSLMPSSSESEPQSLVEPTSTLCDPQNENHHTLTVTATNGTSNLSPKTMEVVAFSNGHNNMLGAMCDLDLTSDTLNDEDPDESVLSRFSVDFPPPPLPSTSSPALNRSRTSPVPFLRGAASNAESNESLPILPSNQKPYDYLLKVLLVGDSDVGKQEILSGLEDGTTDSPYCSSSGAAYKTTTILIDGKRVKLQLWDTSGQGRFCTIIRSYSRGAQGILLVYDITNKWSFEGINRWLKEVDQVCIYSVKVASVQDK